MDKKVDLYKHHIFVCCSSECSPKGGDEIRQKLKAHVKELGLKETIIVTKAGCLGQCDFGPVVVVYPDGIWYFGVTVQDSEYIITHLTNR